MDELKYGGPAFPHTFKIGPPGEEATVIHGGMTLRDYFAIHAPMPTADGLSQSWAETLLGRSRPDWVGDGREDIRFWLEAEAKYRYAVADAMLAARAAGAPAKEG